MPAEVDALGRVEPIYEIHAGWRSPTGGARKLADLPSAARAYLDRLEELSGVAVRYVSVGTRRDQIIEVQSERDGSTESADDRWTWLSIGSGALRACGGRRREAGGAVVRRCSTGGRSSPPSSATRSA